MCRSGGQLFLLCLLLECRQACPSHCHVGGSSHRKIAPLMNVSLALLWLCIGWTRKAASQHVCSHKAYLVGVWNAGPRVVKWLGNGTSDGEASNNDMRYHANCSLILRDSSWHCTDCFATIAQLRKKIGSFNHWELNRYESQCRPLQAFS